MAPDSEPQWPPRSPREALLSTPGGRQRYREMLNQTSPSPSPSRRARPLQNRHSPGGPSADDRIHLDLDDDDDEETLQLKLQEIQARLKLKKLQNARAKGTATAQGQRDEAELGSDPKSTATERRRFQRASTPDAEARAKLRAQTLVQVPASPIKKLQIPALQTSPSRVLLGIDKGLRGKDISLRRVPNNKKAQDGTAAPQRGSHLERSSTRNSNISETSRPLSFNERLTSARTEETFRAERQEKIQKLRTNAFGIRRDEMDDYKKKAVEIPDEPLQAPTFSREDVLGKGKSVTQTLSRSRTLPNIGNVTDNDSISTATVDGGTGDAGDTDVSSFEPYSSLHLSRRILPHVVLARHVSGKKILCIKNLLKDVKAPDFALPDVEQDIVVFAVVARKSEPRAHKPTTAKNGLKAEDRGKYLVMTLVDLDFEIDLFLFNSGFTRFWKLTEGTVIAILNPNIMPPPPGRQDTGRFSLTINSDEDTILEVGAARDLGFCKSVKKDGEACSAWINKKRTEFCEFHSNEAVRKQRSTRLEVNSTGFGGAEVRKKGDPLAEYYSGNKYKSKNKNYDWESRSQFFMAKTHSAADLIDGKDRAPADRKERAEFLKRGLEAKEKEREIMKKLGAIGNAAGREYMQRSESKASNKLTSSASSYQASALAAADNVPKPSIDLSNKDKAVHLSPVKRKRPESSQAGSIGSSSKNNSAFGWGSNLKQKLANMKEGEKLRTEEYQPVRKKTRFVTEKGIREAGRESLGMDLSERLVTLEDEDDDELVIVK